VYTRVDDASDSARAHQPRLQWLRVVEREQRLDAHWQSSALTSAFAAAVEDRSSAWRARFTASFASLDDRTQA
jgi:hypothetical protein